MASGTVGIDAHRPAQERRVTALQVLSVAVLGLAGLDAGAAVAAVDHAVGLALSGQAQLVRAAQLAAISTVQRIARQVDAAAAAGLLRGVTGGDAGAVLTHLRAGAGAAAAVAVGRVGADIDAGAAAAGQPRPADTHTAVAGLQVGIAGIIAGAGVGLGAAVAADAHQSRPVGADAHRQRRLDLLRAIGAVRAASA